MWRQCLLSPRTRTISTIQAGRMGNGVDDSGDASSEIFIFSVCVWVRVLRRTPTSAPQDIAPPGTAHSRFKTRSAYTCYLLQ